MSDCYTSNAGAGKGYDTLCEPLPRVLFEPSSGSRLILPSLVALRSDNPNAVIHYTTDGTAPDTNSAIYSSPITVASPATVIRAIAIVAGCPAGPEANGQYQQWTPAAHFTYACSTDDESGQWSAFASDGNPDYNWELQIQFSAITGVREFSVLQLATSGEFLGAAWSTKEFIFPWENDATKAFRAFPLVIYDTGVQQNVAYLDDYSATLGNFGAAAYTLDMYGQPFFSGSALPSDWLFKLLITFSDGSTVERLVDKACDALPAALCPVPAFSSLTPQCGPPLRIDLTYALTVGTAYGIYRRVQGDSGPFTLLDSGNVAASPETYQDDTVVAGVTYEYFLQNLPTSCTTYMYSIIYVVRATPNPVVGISANPTTINAGGSSTVSWSSSNINGNVTISPTIGAQPGNVAGSQVVAPASTTTYTITGQNFCGAEAEDEFTVTVIPPASCGASQPSQVGISGYSSLMFTNPSCPVRVGGLFPWNGRYTNTAGTCNFTTGPFSWHLGNAGDGNRELNNAATIIEHVGGTWRLTVAAYDETTGLAVTIWRGTKSFGDTPVGAYTRTTGCSSTPASITVVVV